MGFTIDMVSGEMLEESSTCFDQGFSVAIKENPSVIDQSSNTPEYAISEPLLSVVESESVHSPETGMPDSLSQINIDSFLDKFN